MKWIPKQPVISTVQPRLSVHQYLTDLAFDFEKGDMVIENGDLKTVSGLDNFTQKVQKFILTPKTERWNYGFDHKLFEAVNEAVFCAEAEILAKQLVSQVLKGQPGVLNGLGHTIEEIYSMEKTIENNCDYLGITLKATGQDELLIIRVPYPKQ